MTKEQLMTLIQACRAMEKFDEAFHKLTGGSIGHENYEVIFRVEEVLMQFSCLPSDGDIMDLIRILKNDDMSDEDRYRTLFPES